MEFNKDLICSIWHEELTNKEFYVGNTVEELMENVRKDEKFYNIVGFSYNEWFPFSYKSDDFIESTCSMIYPKITDSNQMIELYKFYQNQGIEIWHKFTDGWVSNRKFGKWVFEDSVKNYSFFKK